MTKEKSGETILFDEVGGFENFYRELKRRRQEPFYYCARCGCGLYVALIGGVRISDLEGWVHSPTLCSQCEEDVTGVNQWDRISPLLIDLYGGEPIP